MKKGSQHPTPNAQRPTSKEQREQCHCDDSVPYDLEERLLQFSARIIRLTDALPNSRPGNHVAGQLLRSGTSPLPNHGEAEAAESRVDFVHKLKICLKELRETRTWLLLVQRVPLIQAPDKVTELLDETEQLIRIFYSAIRTATQRPSSNVTREDSIEGPWTLGIERWVLDVENNAGRAS